MSFYTMKGITGVEICEEKDFVISTDMKKLGFGVIFTTGRAAGRDNATKYFVKEGFPYVYAEVYHASSDTYFRIILDKDIYTEYELEKRCITLKTGSGDGSRCVPCVTADNTLKPLHKLFHMEGEIDHIYISLNIITCGGLRTCTSTQNRKNKSEIGTCGFLPYDNKWKISFTERNCSLTDELQRALEADGFKTSVGSNHAIVSKMFSTQKEALAAMREYELKYFGEFAYNPLNNMYGRFQDKFEELILGTITADDVRKKVLADYSNDAKAIIRYGLIPEYEKNGMSYNEGMTLPNGEFVSE